MTPKHDDSEKELVEACKTAVRDLLGPVVGTPEWLAKHGKKIEARHDRHAEAITSAVLTAARPIIEREVLLRFIAYMDEQQWAGCVDGVKFFARDELNIDLTDPKDGDAG